MSHLSQPLWWQERARIRTAKLAEAIEHLKTALLQLGGVQGALIYGSYARGEVGPESDLDIMLIQKSDFPFVERMTNVYSKLRLGIPYDLVVYTPDEFQKLKNTSNFVAQAAREGIWIDARAAV